MGSGEEDVDVGDEAVKYAEEHGDYQDHTLTLRTSIITMLIKTG